MRRVASFFAGKKGRVQAQEEAATGQRLMVSSGGKATVTRVRGWGQGGAWGAARYRGRLETLRGLSAPCRAPGAPGAPAHTPEAGNLGVPSYSLGRESGRSPHVPGWGLAGWQHCGPAPALPQHRGGRGLRPGSLVYFARGRRFAFRPGTQLQTIRQLVPRSGAAGRRAQGREGPRPHLCLPALFCLSVSPRFSHLPLPFCFIFVEPQCTPTHKPTQALPPGCHPLLCAGKG